MKLIVLSNYETSNDINPFSWHYLFFGSNLITSQIVIMVSEPQKGMGEQLTSYF